MQDNKKINNIIVTFSDYQVPEFKEVKYSNQKWVRAGKDNKYPDYLLDLLRRSTKHSSIIKGKAKYIIGKGFKIKGAKNSDSIIVNKANESLNKVGKKSVIDLETQGGFFLQIIWSKGQKIGEVYHLDYHKVRSNKDNTEFYYLEKGWTEYTSADFDEIETFAAFDPNVKKGTQIFYYKEYTPGLDTYCLPEYIAALNHIEADSLVGEHVLNNAKTGFTASKIINLNNGTPESEEAKIRIEKAIKEKYTGKKGSKIIITFNDDPAKAPTVLDLGSSDLTKEDFTRVDNLIQQNIYANHQITSPILFGIKTEGQLGGRTELREAYEIFKNTYVDDKQDEVSEAFNYIGQFAGWKTLEILPKEPLSFSVPDSDISGLLTDDEKRQKLGLEALKYDAKDPKAVLQLLSSLNPKVADAVIGELSSDEIRSLVGLQPKTPEQKQEDAAKKAAQPQPGQQQPGQQQPQDPQQQQQQFSDDETLLKMFEECGEPANKYDVLKKKKTIDSIAEQLNFSEVQQTEANILDLISKDKRITPDAIAAVLELPVPYVERLLNELEDGGFIKSTVEKIGEDTQVEREVLQGPEVKPMTAQVFVKYSYEGPYDDKNRAFCHRMMELNRLYSRSEIEQISQRVGYSVWERRGGFYHNPDTGLTTPYCRHSWLQNIVVKRK